MCRNNNGFTLIELLVAMALLVILSGALYGTYFSITAARERGGERIDARREVSSTLDLMRKELVSTFYSTGMPPTTPANATNTNPGQNLQFVVEDRDVFGKPTSLLQLTAVTPPVLASIPSSDVEAVRYAIQEKDGVLTLTREAKDLYLHVKSTPYPVIDNVDSFLVECYSGGNWVKTWDTAFTHRLPDAVRVTVTVKGGEKFAIVATPGLNRKSAPLSGLGGINLSNLGSIGGTGSGGIGGSSDAGQQ